MAIASTVLDLMAQYGIRYDVITHPHSSCSSETAELAHIPGRCLAKSVVLEDDNGYLMAVLPATSHVSLGRLGKELHRPVHLASEPEVARLFSDCEPGAIPPLGAAYGLRTVMDDSLAAEPEIYFEAGDHQCLIQMGRDDFLMMMEDAAQAHFGDAPWYGHGGNVFPSA